MLAITSTGVELLNKGEYLRVDCWGDSTFRVRAGRDSHVVSDSEVLMSQATRPTRVKEEPNRVSLVNGELTAVIESHGRVSFLRNGEVILEEPEYDPREPPLLPHRRTHRDPSAIDNETWNITTTFTAHDDERFYGLGQQLFGRLNLKGCVVELVQRNSQVSIPVVISSRGYGMFFNSPSVGQVEFAANFTRWHAYHARELDYFVYGGENPGAILARYHALTGLSPKFPHWATGFWQSKSYYTSQEEVLSVAREHVARGLPLAAIFVDYMHWTHVGNWDWDQELWPDPAGMAEELASHGVRLLVAVWPHLSPYSDNIATARAQGMLVGSVSTGSSAVFPFADRLSPEGLDLSLLDVSRQDAGALLWERMRAGYASKGITSYWLDASEPEIRDFTDRYREEDLRFSTGPGGEIASRFPWYYARAVREGMIGDGLDDGMILVRSAWAGSQRFGVTVWSGDIQSTWSALQAQVAAGLGMMASGIPWWTTDIGGFFDSDIDSDDFRELMIRWFQFAVFWPVVRLHGNRNPDFFNAGIFSSGGANEVWSFGDEAYEILRGLLGFRERLRPYVQQQLDRNSLDGTPPVQPLWFAFPDDAIAVGVEDQFMVGDDLLVAPVVERGVRARPVYLPAGSSWRDVWTGTVHDGGQTVSVDAPLDRIPLFERTSSALGVSHTWFELEERPKPIAQLD